MSTLFSRIIAGELPGRFLWREELCSAFLSAFPLRPGHALVVPIREVDHWLDLTDDELARITSVGKLIGEAQQEAFDPPRVGLLVAGFEVPHAHLHVVPIRGMEDLDLANADHDPEPAALDAAADALRSRLGTEGLAAS